MCHVDEVHRFQDRVLMDGSSMDAPGISALVVASMHGVHILSLICMWNAYSTWIFTVSWSYMHPEHPLITLKQNNDGLTGGSSIGALVSASTHGCI